jgi:hypothetical protein
MPVRRIVNDHGESLISRLLETPEGSERLASSMIEPIRIHMDNQDYLRSALMSYDSTARVGDMLWTVGSGEGSEWVVDTDRMAMEDRIGSEEVNLYNYLHRMKILKEERELENLRENIPHCSIMWLEI